MLTIQGLNSTCPGYGRMFGLGKYMLNEDFRCVRDRSIYACVATGPNKAVTLAAFKGMQAVVRDIAAQMSLAGTLRVPSQLSTLIVDGQPGNTTALGVQFVGAAFMPAVPPTDPEVAFALTPTGDAEADIEKIAAYANEIVGYFQYVVLEHPEALRPSPEIVEKVVEVEKIIQKEYVTRFRPIGAIVLASGLLALLGLTATAVYFSRPNHQRIREF